MMFKHVFLDMDDTLLDFLLTERDAISNTLRAFGKEPTEERITTYSAINLETWERFERGEIPRERIFQERFETLFSYFGWSLDPAAFNEVYRTQLSLGHPLIPGAKELLDYLAPKYHLYIASNGTADTQDRRLRDAGIVDYFDQVFISERVGFHKPEKAYFDTCFAAIPGFRHEQAILIGDSLSSDILGGKNAGIATCWFNYRKKPKREEPAPDYTVFSLNEIKIIL